MSDTSPGHMSQASVPDSADLGVTTGVPIGDVAAERGPRPGGPGAQGVLAYINRSNNLYILLVLAGLVILFSLISPNHAFFAKENFISIAWDTAEILLLAIGETFVIITAGIDLSVGTVLMLSGLVASWVMLNTAGTPAQIAHNQYPNVGWAIGISIPAGLLVGIVFGLINGVCVTALRLPPFIVTLGTFGIAYGLSQLLFSAGAAGESAIPPVPPTYANSLGNGNLVIGLPTLVVVSIVAAIIASIILTRTLFGRRTFAVGSNLEGSRLAGVPVNRHLLYVYVLAGFMSGLAGIFDLARFQAVDVSGHSLDNLNAIAAVVIGGTSLFGGSGSVFGTAIGAFIPIVLLYGFTIQGISTQWQEVAVGAIIILAVLVDQVRRRRMA